MFSGYKVICNKSIYDRFIVELFSWPNMDKHLIIITIIV